jgi:Reverse transcriptase (RNA-dependent DNA polymerase).
MAGVLQGSELGPCIFLAYANDIWSYMEPTIRLFADDCLIYRKIMGGRDIEKLQIYLDCLGDWVVENEVNINPGKVEQ